MTVYAIPKATLGRIPLYIQFLKDLPEESGATISATKIARGLTLGEVQVRKDLALISGCGRPKIGYDRDQLLLDLERHLGCDGFTNAVLVGAGKLGRALLDYDDFDASGFQILAAFDLEPGDAEQNHEKPIYPMSRLQNFCRYYHVRIGIITVPAESAQAVCDLLVSCGVSAIWNFAPVHLKVPDHVIVQSENLAVSLTALRIQMRKQKPA